MTKSEKLLGTYVKMLEKQRELSETYKTEMDAITADRNKLAGYLIEADEFEEVPDILCEEDPNLAWSIGVQNDAFAIRLYRVLRDKVQGNNRAAKDFEAEQNHFKESIGGWLLAALNKSGAKSVNCGSAGRAYKKLKVRANAADWDAFLQWAADNKAGDAIQKRVNASFVTKYEEAHDELPPFIDVFKEYEVVVTK